MGEQEAKAEAERLKKEQEAKAEAERQEAARKKKEEEIAIANMKDPIQDLFLTSIRAYSTTGGLENADKATQAEVQAELARVNKQEAKAEAERLKKEQEAKAKAEAEKLKKEQEAKAKAEKIKKEQEAKAEAERLKKEQE